MSFKKQRTSNRKIITRWSKPLSKKLGNLRQKLLLSKRKCGLHLKFDVGTASKAEMNGFEIIASSVG